MKRTVNFKAVAILAVGALLFGVTVHFVHAFQMDRRGRDLLALVADAERDKQPEQTIVYLENYLGLVPDDFDAQAKYALLLKETAKTRQQKIRAYFVLDKVLRRDPDRADIRRAAVESAVAFGRFSEARGMLDEMQKAAPNDADLALLSGRCELGARNIDGAVSWLVRATEMAPQRITMCVEVADLLRDRLDRPYFADQVMDRVGNQPGRAARTAAARYFARAGVWDKADVHVRAALADAAAPEPDLLLIAADVARKAGRFDEARKHLELGLAAAPRDATITRRLAELDLIQGQKAPALERLESKNLPAPQKPDELWETARLLIELEQWDKATELLTRLDAARATAAASLLRGRMLMRKYEWGAARVELEKAAASSPPATIAKFIYLFLAESQGRLGLPDQQLASCRLAVEADRSWLPGRLALAEAYAAANQLDRAADEFRAVASESPDARAGLARVLVARNRKLPREDRKWDEVDSLLAAGGDKPSTDVAQLRLDVLLIKEQLAEARKVLEAERDRDPAQVGPWLALAQLADRQRQPGGGLAVVSEAERKLGPRVEWELYRARRALAAPRADALKELTRVESTLGRYDPPDQVRLAAGLADAYMFAGEAGPAGRLWRLVAEKAPQNLSARLTLLELALQGGAAGEAEAARLTTDIRRIEGDNGPYTAYAEAVRLVNKAIRGDAESLSAARPLLARAANQLPSWSRVAALQGEVYELEGNPDKAVEKYREAIERGDSRLGLVRRTLQLLAAQRRFADANALVGRMSQQTLTETGLGRIAAQLWLADPNATDPNAARAQALEMARKSVATTSRDYRDYLWLGQIAFMANQTSEAEQAFRQAVRLEPAAPEPRVALVALLAKSDPKLADAELQALRKDLPREVVPLVAATCLDLLNRPQQAEAEFIAAAAARPKDPGTLTAAAEFFIRSGQTSKAVAQLRALLDPGVKAPATTSAWARRTLALSIAANSGYANYREALALIEANGDAAPEDRLVKAVVLAMLPANRKAAIGLFETLTAQRAAVPPDARLVLAQLYEADGNWPRAASQLLGLVTEHEANPLYVANYVRGLLRHDRADEAGRWADKLLALRPQSAESYALKARVLHAQGDAAGAAAQVKAGVRLPDAGSRWAGHLFEDIGQPAEAEKSFREYAADARRPEGALILAQFLARRGNVAEAMALCEKAWQTCPPLSAAVASVGVVQAPQAQPEQRGRVEQWLQSALARHADLSVPILALTAELYEVQGRYPDAVRAYRKCLDSEPRNALVLNNLAFLLANTGSSLDEALAMINTAIEVAGPRSELLDTRAAVYLKRNQPDLAIKDSLQAVSQDGKPAAYCRLALGYLATKNRVAAEEAFRKAGGATGIKSEEFHPLDKVGLVQLQTTLRAY
jgi:Tfp pilus assembly protein PilF